MNIRLDKISAFSLISCSGLYLSQIIISPVYFIVLIGLFLFFIGDNKIANVYKYQFYSVGIFFIYLLATNFARVDFSIYGNLFITAIVAIFTPFTLRNLSKKDKSSVFKWYMLINILLVSIDAYWRFTHPDYESAKNLERLYELGLGFQLYKTNSLMYIDSNFVANQVLISIVALLILSKIKLRNNYTFFALLILLLLCLSRSAVITFSLTMVYIYFNGINKKFKKMLGFLFPIFIIIISYEIYKLVQDDLSFQSKFHIFSISYDYFINANAYNKLFGVGLTNGVYAIGKGTHSLYATLFIETGLIGVLLFSNMILSLFVKKYIRPLIIAYLITSFSLGSIMVPYFYALIWFIFDVKKFEKPA